LKKTDGCLIREKADKKYILNGAALPAVLSPGWALRRGEVRKKLPDAL